MQVFKQFHKIFLDIFNHMLPSVLEPVLSSTSGARTGFTKASVNDTHVSDQDFPSLAGGRAVVIPLFHLYS